MRTIRQQLTQPAHSRPHGTARVRQRGAALVVGLLMLMVITLLAIAGMNSASVEFVMAGNSQFHQYAFQAAESGIQQTLATQTLVPGQATVNFGPTTLSGTVAGDSYSGRLFFVSSSNGSLPWNYSGDQFTSFDYQINSTGTSARNSTSAHQQGITQIAPGAKSNTTGNGGGSFTGSGGSGGGTVAIATDLLN